MYGPRLDKFWYFKDSWIIIQERKPKPATEIIHMKGEI